MRLFIAIQFTQQLRQALLDAIADLQAQGAKGNFTRPENLHLTLAFIGESERVEELSAAIDAAAGAAFELALSQGGNFGDLYWAGLAPSAELEGLVRRLRRELTARDFAIDARRFRPHITLARQLRAPAPLTVRLNPARMQAQCISLMRSERVEGKLVYSELYARNLKSR